VYSLLAGRSPFEIPGGANTSSDLMGRIARAKPQPIGRPDVPASLEAVLRKAMSRRPDQRPASALDLVREFQLIEAELGLPQTAAEIAMDDWALGTVADQEERTRLRPVSTGSAPPKAGRRRRRPAPSESYAPVGTVRERSGPDGPFSRSAPGETSPGIRRLAWVLAGAAALVTVLGVVVLVVLLRTVGDGIPVVSDIEAEIGSGGRVDFSWPDPGLDEGDRYQITVTDDGIASSPALQSANRFVVDADPGDTVCLSVVVNRNGTPGATSAEKCVDIAGD
jgi:hypothetical protein